MSKYFMFVGKYRCFFQFSGKYSVNTPKISSKSKKVYTLGKYPMSIYLLDTFYVNPNDNASQFRQ